MAGQKFNLETLVLNMENFRGQTVFDRKKNGYFVDYFKSCKNILNFKKEESIIKATYRPISLLYKISISYKVIGPMIVTVYCQNFSLTFKIVFGARDCFL